MRWRTPKRKPSKRANRPFTIRSSPRHRGQLQVSLPRHRLRRPTSSRARASIETTTKTMSRWSTPTASSSTSSAWTCPRASGAALRPMPSGWRREQPRAEAHCVGKARLSPAPAGLFFAPPLLAAFTDEPYAAPAQFDGTARRSSPASTALKLRSTMSLTFCRRRRRAEVTRQRVALHAP
jgi:hypothetical protein